MVTGSLVEALVEGLRSWLMSGWCVMEADWIVEAISRGMEEDMVGVCSVGGV